MGILSQPGRGVPPGLPPPKAVLAQGGPVVLAGQWWTEGKKRVALDRGPHQYTMAHVPFLWEEFASMVGKVQWVVLAYSVAKDLQGLSLIPSRVKDEREWRPW